METGLSIGTKLSTDSGNTVTILRQLGEGGQGFVYEVDYGGDRKALKWYKASGMGDTPETFREVLRKNIKRKSPAPEFLWPQDLTQWKDGKFGYIMDLKPQGYYEIWQFLLCHVRFASFQVAVDAMLNIVSAFRILHNQGYTYRDLNDGNFFINPKNGDVRVADNDNVAPQDVKNGIRGKPRYMAPEVVTGSFPDVYSDRHSMALILYMLLCLNHPLEGSLYLTAGLTEAKKKALYGTNPVFMMASNARANAPHPQVHINSLRIWRFLPDYMRKIFLRAFSRTALLEKREARPEEIDWLKALTRFRNDLVSCQCGNEVIAPNAGSCKCDSCGKTIPIPYRLELPSGSAPAIRGTRIYRCQLGPCKVQEALDPIGMVGLKKGESGLFMRNMTGFRWYAEEKLTVAPGELLPIKDGTIIYVKQDTIKITKNN